MFHVFKKKKKTVIVDPMTSDDPYWVQRRKEWNKTEKYLSEKKELDDKYFPLLEEIESLWSKIYHSKIYDGADAEQLEKACIRDIEYYKEIIQFEHKNHSTAPPNVPAYRRLAMLYEKQGRYEEATSITKDSLLVGANGIDAASRLRRLIKKVGRIPTDEENALMGSVAK